MPNWKKVIVSGSSAHLNHVTASGNISGSGTTTGSFGTIETSTGTIPTLIGNTTVRDNLTVSGQLSVTGKTEISREPIQGFNYLARLAEGEVSASAKAHTFTATAQTKSANHPYKNLGSGNGYIIDGVETPFLYLTEGHYKFDYSGATSHPIRFYFDAAKTTQYAPSSHVSVDGNVITLKIDKDSPQILYYQCSSHGYMGWAIHTGQNPLVQDENGLRTLFSGSGQITHDDTDGFVANEHIDHTSVTLTAGTGLSGGGTIAANRSFAVDFSDSTLQTAVSGAFTTASSSLATRITDATASINFLSSSLIVDATASINTLSASLGDATASLKSISGSQSTRLTTLETASGSFSTRTTTVESRVNQGVKTTDSPTFDNITATGTITAQEFKTEFVSASITFSSGSTKFGDDITYKHEFTGSLKISGSIEADTILNVVSESGQLAVAISGSFGNQRVGTTDDVQFAHVTASGNVSASGTSTGSFGRLEITDNVDIGGSLAIAGFANVSSSLAAAVAGGDNLGNHTATQDLDLDGNDITGIQHITASGNISGSKTGSFGSILVGGGYFTSASLAAGGSGGSDNLGDHTATQDLDLGGNDITNLQHVTASGNVSASATSTASFGRFEGDGSGLSNVAASITVKEEGTNLTTAVSSIDFVGEGLTATTSGNDVTVTQNLTSGAGDAVTITISDASTTWAVTHSLDNKYPTVTIYDENDQVIIPSTITADTVDTATITFEQPVSGKASFTLGIPTASIFISGSGQIATELADATISGSLTLTGKLTAQEFHTEFTSASIIFSSGSNKFGDDLTDKHEFTGSIIASSSLQVTGSISTSGSVTAESFSGIFSGAVSSSAQLATAISGSFTSVSSSINTRLNSLSDDIIALSIALG